MSWVRNTALAMIVGASSAGCGPRGPADIDQHRLAEAEGEPGNWTTHGRTWSEDRYSTLEQVNRANVNQLGVAWSYEFKTGSGAEATPLVIDGVMYVTSSWSIVYALDAATGKELWVYDLFTAGAGMLRASEPWRRDLEGKGLRRHV